MVVAIPIFYLFWALAIQRMKGYLAGVSTLLITIVLTIIVYQMPVSTSLAAAGLGMTTGLFPIGWIILTAVFLFNLTVDSGRFKSSIAPSPTFSRISTCKRCSSPFHFQPSWKASAGQGAPVAVAAAMLIGLGFPAVPAAVICLIANTPLFPSVRSGSPPS